jgi:hypothetical protein
MSRRDSDRFSLDAGLQRYDRLIELEHCHWLNQTVRNTMRLLTFLSLTRYQPVHADDIARFTGLSEEFVSECLATLQFDGFVRETDLGFQCELVVERMTWRDHKALNQCLQDMGQEVFRVRARSGSWQEEYFWPEEVGTIELRS